MQFWKISKPHLTDLVNNLKGTENVWKTELFIKITFT